MIKISFHDENTYEVIVGNYATLLSRGDELIQTSEH